MSAKTIALATVAVCMIISLSTAQGRQGHRAAGSQPAWPASQPSHRPPPPSPLMHALDTNLDGELSAGEIANAPQSLLKLDKNGDGKLTREELMPPPPGNQDEPAGPPPGHRPPPPMGPLMRALDTDRDGELSAEEIANASQSLLKLDKNGDGKLTLDELMPPPPPNPLMQVLDTNKDGEGVAKLPGRGQFR